MLAIVGYVSRFGGLRLSEQGTRRLEELRRFLGEKRASDFPETLAQLLIRPSLIQAEPWQKASKEWKWWSIAPDFRKTVIVRLDTASALAG
jgi:hypothetical protein